MSSIVIDQGIVHYETYGSGKPVLLLHGWLGSWELWRNTIEVLGGRGGGFRIYALDFWGFGESDDKRRVSFAVDDFIKLVNQFMERLGIVRAPLVGHSMGGTVSLGVALDYPRQVSKVMVVGSPINGQSLYPLLKLSGHRIIGHLFRGKIGYPLFKTGMRVYAELMAKDAEGVWRMLIRDTDQTTAQSFFESISTLHRTDLRPRLHEIQVPVTGLYGKKDVIVDPGQHKVLAEGVSHAKILLRPDSGHFTMLDEPDFFVQAVREFLLSEGDTPQE
ncbi:MAG: alpha/beta hydrolase [Anaerolineae bacterium]|nr:alpha/beta hydrolase [Anaerolineae bacterium]